MEHDDRVATIILSGPDQLNAINRSMPDEIRAAVEQANPTTSSMSSWPAKRSNEPYFDPRRPFHH